VAYIDHERFLDLKKRVREECLKRCYTGSVLMYGSQDFDFENQPAEGNLILGEHYEKIATPLAAINSDLVPDLDPKRIVSEEELAMLEAAVTTFEAESKARTTPGECKSSCTGTCYTECSASCTGSCGGNCSGGCLTSCNGCDGCSGSCTNVCSGCTSTCKTHCTGGCSGSCKETCTVSCGFRGCSGSCRNHCYNGCVSSCGGGCSTCGSNCSGVSLVGTQSSH